MRERRRYHASSGGEEKIFGPLSRRKTRYRRGIAWHPWPRKLATIGMSIEPRVSSSSAGRSFSSYIVTPSDQAVTSWEKEVFTTLRQGLLVRKPGPALKEVLQP